MPPTRKSDDDKAKRTEAERPVMAPETALGIEPDADDRAYTDAAADLATAARETAEKIREQLADLRDKYDGVQSKTPGLAEANVSAGVQRLPMAIGEVERALEGLLMAGAELASRAIR